MTTETETDTSEDKIAADIIQKIRRRAEEIQNKPGVNSCIFRGEAQSDWGDGESNKKVSSSLYRMLKENVEPELIPHDMLPFEKSIVEKAQKHIEKTALTIGVLSELQHYGGKTNLIDFTKDLHVALFFACTESIEEDGRLILLPLELKKIKHDITYQQTNNPSTLSIASFKKFLDKPHQQRAKHGIKNTDYSETGYILVEPTGKNPRPIFQSSIFIHPLRGYLEESLAEKNSIPIKASDKKAISQYLEKYHNINWNTIYNDIHGYIQNQKNDRDMEFFFGMSAQMRDKHEKAIAHYTKAIELNPQLADAYFNRGLSYAATEKHKKATADFTKTIELNP